MLKRCAGAVSLLMLGALLAPSPSSADTGSGWTAPTKLAGVAEPATGLTASSAGVAYGADDGIVYRKAGATDPTVMPNVFGGLISGSSMIVQRYNARQDPGGFEFVDLNSGATSNTAETVGGLAANLGGIALAGACCTNPTNFVLTHSDGTTETISIPVGFVEGEAGIDANGFAFWSMNTQETKYVLYYYDLTTRTYREIQRGDGAAWGNRIAVTTHDIVWLINNTVYRTPRTGGAITQAPAPAGSNPATSLAATDNVTAFLTNGSVILRTAMGDSTANVPSAHVITTDGTNFIVGSNADVNTAGVYQVSPTGQSQELFPLRRVRYQMWPFLFTLGHIYYGDNSASGSPSFARAVGSDVTSTVNVGDEQRLGFWPWGTMSGDRLAYSQQIAGVWHLRVLRNGRLERDFRVPGPPEAVHMSGPRIVMSGAPNIGPWWTRLADVTTGSLTTLNVLDDGAAIWGPMLVYVDMKDNLWRRDLTRPTSKSNPRLLMTPKRFGHSIFWPAIWGDWVEWNDALMNTRTGERLTITGMRGQLADGSLTWLQSDGMDSNTVQPMVMNLSGSDRTPIALGRLTYSPYVVEDKFAWQDGTNRLLHIDELPFNGTDVARALYLTPKRAFTPNGKRHYVVELDSTKALKSWAIEIRGPHGALIRRWTGTGLTSGVVKVGWDGTSGSGHRVAAGTYTVKVSGIAADGSGALRRAIGAKHPLSWVAVSYPH